MLEPLAQALASLSSEAARTLSEIEQLTRTASVDYQRQINAANDSLGRAVTATTRATNDLRRAASSLSWGHYGLAAVTGLVTAVLVSGFWLCSGRRPSTTSWIPRWWPSTSSRP